MTSNYMCIAIIICSFFCRESFVLFFQKHHHFLSDIETGMICLCFLSEYQSETELPTICLYGVDGG